MWGEMGEMQSKCMDSSAVARPELTTYFITENVYWLQEVQSSVSSFGSLWRESQYSMRGM